MSQGVFFMICSILVLRYANNWRGMIAVTMVATISAAIVFPPPAFAQFGLLGSIQNIISVINGTIQSALNAINGATEALLSIHEQIVWPVSLINRARSSIASIIDEFRNVLRSMYGAPTNSATLAAPIGLESSLRNGQTDDFASLVWSYHEVFGALPSESSADPATRNLIDMDDALALSTMKTVKASDRANNLILESAKQIEDEASSAAPGSAPFLTAAAMAANIQSQATMQKMLAAMIRQEAARLAHENAIHKRHGVLASRARQGVSDMLIRR